MEHYRVFLRGENFILEVDGEAACLGSACLGFYTTRFVQAEGREAAEILAVDLIRGDRTLAGVKNTRDNPPMDLRGRDRRIVGNEVQSNSGYSFFKWTKKPTTRVTHERTTTRATSSPACRCNSSPNRYPELRLTSRRD